MANAAQVQAVERLVHESVQRVDAIAPEALRALLPALRQARDELRADLYRWLSTVDNGQDRFTAFQRARALRALEATFARVGELQPSMAGALGLGRGETGVLAVKNLEHEVQRLSSIFGGGHVVLPQIDTAAIVAKGDRLLFKRHARSAQRYAAGIGDDIRTRMAVSLAKGDTFEQMVQRLRGSPEFKLAVQASDPGAAAHGVADAMFHRWRHWADRLVRTENMHAYNVQHDLSIEQVNADRHEDEDEYLRRWDATADNVACPRCRDLDRRVATIKGDFLPGVHSPPLHPYCRCVVLAWLARWGNIKGEVPSKGDDGKDVEPKRSLPPKSKPKEPKPKRERKPREVKPKGEAAHHKSAIEAMSKRDVSAARQATDDAFRARGFSPHAATNAQAKTEIKPILAGGKAAGLHHLQTGKIEIDKEHADKAEAFAKEWGKDPKAARAAIDEYQKQRRDFYTGKSTTLSSGTGHQGYRMFHDGYGQHVLVHESLHGFGATMTNEYYGTGAAIEEVTTEMMARRITRERYGIDYHAITKRGKVVRAFAAYEPEIQKVIRGIRQATGLTHAKALRVLEDAAEEYKKAPADQSRLPHERIAETVARLVPPKDPDRLQPARYGMRRDGSTPSRHESNISNHIYSELSKP